MTLCIAAPARSVGTGVPCIILCFDSKVANDQFGSETEHKFYVLSDGLMALVAGRPSRGKRLSMEFQELLRQSTPQSEKELVDLLERGVAINKKHMADFYMGSRLAVSYDDLLKNGEQWFGQELRDSLMGTIKGLKIGADMIVAGFLANSPVIVRIEGDSIDVETNFSMIGSGAGTAEPAMHARAHGTKTLFPEALYNVYEAKRLGESSPYVGAETRIYILHPPKREQSKLQVEVVLEPGKKALKRKFGRYGPKPLPSAR